MGNKKPTFSRGYSESRQRVQKSLSMTRSCFNCNSYYQASGDKEEVCQNPNVTEFDMVVAENNIYCVYWSQCKNKEEHLFKSGRDRLD